MNERLTKYLEECWPDEFYYNGPPERLCKKCSCPESAHVNRSFTTWPDLGALVEKMRANKDLFNFGQYLKAETSLDDDFYIFTGHLNPTRFCKLVNGWLEGKEKV